MIESVLWRRLDSPGHEIGILKSQGNGWELTGTAVFVHGKHPCRLDYKILCDESWRTISARINGVVGIRVVDLSVSANDRQRWQLNGVESPSVQGCFDVDLGFSPSTNLLPIRRLSLEIGEEAAVEAAWLPFPSLELQLLKQSFRREGKTTYTYSSRGGGFVRTLEVNGSGLVTSYPGIWQAEGVIP